MNCDFRVLTVSFICTAFIVFRVPVNKLFFNDSINHRAMFGCQLTEVLESIFGDRFIDIYSMFFSPGSVLVNSVIRLSTPASDRDISNVTAGISNTFARNGFVVDQISFVDWKNPNGNCKLAICGCR